jgi:hypothetical protein
MIGILCCNSLLQHLRTLTEVIVSQTTYVFKIMSETSQKKNDWLIYILPACVYTEASNILVTNSMEQRPSWEANSFSASQEIPRILWNQKVRNRTQNHRPPVPILNKRNRVHASPSQFLKTHFNIILPILSKWFLFMKCPHQIPVFTPPFPTRAKLFGNFRLYMILSGYLGISQENTLKYVRYDVLFL